jgi:hypothetical protein
MDDRYLIAFDAIEDEVGIAADFQAADAGNVSPRTFQWKGKKRFSSIADFAHY